MTEVLKHTSTSCSDKVTGSEPIIDGSKRKRNVECYAAGLNDPGILSSVTTTATVVTQARAIVTPIDRSSTLTNANAHISQSSIEANVKQKLATTTTAPIKEAQAEAVSSKMAVTPAKPPTGAAKHSAVAVAAVQNTNGGTLPVLAEMSKTTSSAPAPPKMKRFRETEDYALENAPSEKSKATPTTQSTKSQAARRKNAIASTARDKTPAHKLASKPKVVASNPASSTAEPQPKRTKAFKSRRGPSFHAAEAFNASVMNDVPM